jgi:hypothetical protein
MMAPAHAVGSALLGGALALAALCVADAAQAQQAPPANWPPPGGAPPPPGYAPQPAYATPGYGVPDYPDPRSRPANSYELGALYVVSAAYGIGVGAWLDAEFEITDPGVLLIMPTVFGVAAPVGAYLANQPPMRRGKPAAIAAGMAIGAGEGLGIASLQMATSDDPWGFRGLSRSMMLGSTIGGVAGYAVGELQQPSPNISAFAGSGVLWGTLAGSMIGLGASPQGEPFSESNDWMARGGLIGFNVGLAATAGLSTLFVPSMQQLSWMWIGAGVGAVASLPIYLFYIGDDAPDAKRGLLFTSTAMTLGIVAGGVFGPAYGPKLGSGGDSPSFASITGVAPLLTRDAIGVRVSGSLY